MQGKISLRTAEFILIRFEKSVSNLKETLFFKTRKSLRMIDRFGHS